MDCFGGILWGTNIGTTAYASSKAEEIVAVAKSQVGKGGSTYQDWLNYGHSAAWCHMFVSWCANQVGVLNTGIYKTAVCDEGRKWFIARNRWKDRGYTPSRGDIIYFKYERNDKKTTNHVGIVDYSSNGTVYTIEGNCKNEVKLNGGYSNGYALNDSKIVGYGIPDYNTISGPKDLDAPKVTDAKVLDQNDKGYMLECKASDNVGVNSIKVATWTDEKGQDDLKWVDMVKWDNGTYRLFINFSDHGNVKNDTYINHVYAYDNGGNSTAKTVEYVCDSEAPKITNAKVSDLTKDGYTVTCNVSDNKSVSRVNLATWTANTKNGDDQDDIIWQEIQGGENGKEYKWEVKFNKHNNEKNVTYYNHIYAYDVMGTSRSVACNLFVPDEVDHLDEFKYDSTKNELRMKGWAISKDKIKEVVYIMDNQAEIPFKRYSRTDVAKAYPGYPTGTEGFDLTINGDKLISGQHTVQIIVRTEKGYEHNLGSVTFTSRADLVPKQTIVRNGIVYSIYDEQMTWTDANQFASQMNSSLIKVDSANKKKILTEIMEYGGNQTYWIGAQRTEGDTWKWTDGTTVNYSDWAPNEPNNLHGIENYCAVYSNGKWEDVANIASKTGFITETKVAAIPTATSYSNGHYYYLYEQNLNWYEAKAYCESIGGHLVTISNAEEQNIVFKLVQSRKDPDYARFIIGASNKSNGKWSWVNGEPFSYTNWNSGEPNNEGKVEFYGEMLVSNGKWNDVKSYRETGKQGFVCEFEEDKKYTTKEAFGRNEYWRIDKSLSWEDAKQYCEHIGGHLAIISSAEENAAVAKLLKRATDNVRTWYYIGAENVSSGKWKWVDGSEVGYTNWASGEPNDVGQTEHYLSMTAADGKWNDSNNIFNHGGLSSPAFICEFENTVAVPTPKPTIKPTAEPTVKPTELPTEIPPTDPVQTPDITDAPDTTETPTKEPSQDVVQIHIGNASGKAGDTVTVPVKIDHNTGLFSASMELVYDTEKLTPLAVTAGEVFKNGTLQTDFENGTKVLWMNDAMNDVTENGTIFEVSFMINEDVMDEDIPITINKENLDLCNFSEESCECDVTAGAITIGKAILSGGNVSGVIGKRVEVPVSISDNAGINAFSITTKFNNAILTPEKLEAGELIRDNGVITSNIDDENTDWGEVDYITALWVSENPDEDMAEDGELYTVVFRISMDAEEGDSPIEFTEYDATNAAGTNVGLGAENGNITLEEMKYLYGDLNCDGNINVLDVVAMKKFILNPETSGVDEIGRLAADVNVDGKIDIKDLTRLRKYAAKYKDTVLGQ